jgi:hypothetical protein
MATEQVLNLVSPSAGDVAAPVAACRPLAGARRAVSDAIRARSIPFITGAVLVGAGLLKTEKLWTEGISEQSFIGSWGLVSLIELELGAGLALLTNVSPRLLRRIALVLFAAFTGVALSKAAAGERSCSCAGHLSISPILAVVGDLFILTALWRWRPERRPGSTWLKAGLTVTLVAVAPWPLLAAFRPAAYPRLVVSPVIDLGQLEQGERRSFALRLRNPHDRAVEIVALESTCPCLESTGVPARAGAGETQALGMALDLSREPAFTGPLSVEVTGRTSNGSIAFSTRVRTTVRRANSTVKQGRVEKQPDRSVQRFLATSPLKKRYVLCVPFFSSRFLRVIGSGEGGDRASFGATATEPFRAEHLPRTLARQRI